MKKYLFKCVFKCLAIAFLLAIALQSFAINFNESRRVIIPQHANAVYRGLTVLDTAYIYDKTLAYNQWDGRYFLIEIGKRPTFFWDRDSMFYLYQQQELTLKKFMVSYEGGPFVEVAEGFRLPFFLDTGTFMYKGIESQTPLGLESSGPIVVRKDSSVIVRGLYEKKGTLSADDMVSNWNISTKQFEYSKRVALGYGNTLVKYNIHNLFLRDVNFNAVKFPSPRLMIYKDTGYGVYKAKGTATEFDLPTIPSAAPHNFYGQWELWSPAAGKPNGTLSYTSASACKDDYMPNKCYKYVGGVNTPDTTNLKFTCAGTTAETQGGTYDPVLYEGNTDYCYDYQSISTTPSSYSDGAGYYNNNGVYFETRVEEIFQVDDTTGETTLIRQAPETRVRTTTTGNKAIPISTMTAMSPDVWEFNSYSNMQYVYVDGKGYYLAAGMDLVELGNDTNLNLNPCFYLCNGRICQQNIAYIRDSEYKRRELKGGDEAVTSSLWAQEEGPKQHLVMHTYTIGVCPKKSDNNTYEGFEVNYQSDTASEYLIDGKLIKNNSGNWVPGYACLRRKVKCNKISGESSISSIRPLTTDY